MNRIEELYDQWPGWKSKSKTGEGPMLQCFRAGYEACGIEADSAATALAMKSSQTVGEKSQYYITLLQLAQILTYKGLQVEKRPGDSGTGRT